MQGHEIVAVSGVLQRIIDYHQIKLGINGSRCVAGGRTAASDPEPVGIGDGARPDRGDGNGGDGEGITRWGSEIRRTAGETGNENSLVGRIDKSIANLRPGEFHPRLRRIESQPIAFVVTGHPQFVNR